MLNSSRFVRFRPLGYARRRANLAFCASVVLCMVWTLIGAGAAFAVDESTEKMATVTANEPAHDPAHAASQDAAHAGAGGADAHAAGRQPSQIIKPDLSLWTVFIFLGLLLVLGKFAWKPIIDGLHAREKSIHDEISEAKRQNEEAKSLLSQYQQQLAQAAEQVKAMLEEARRDSEHTKEQIISEARSEATAERNRALRDIGVATDQALKTLAEQSANLAVSVAGKILQKQMSAADHAELIKQAVGEFSLSGPSKN